MIDNIAWVVIPTEILLLTIFSRRFIFNDAYTNVACAGMIYLSYKVWGSGFGWNFLAQVQQLAIFHFEFNFFTVLLHVLVGDLCFYVFHRAAHSRYLFLIDHSVHHSSQYFDYSTNLRISFMAPLYSWFPLIVPSILGFNIPLLFACFGLANSVPFFMHNTRTPKLGWSEYIFNTPSHHRVHHGKNACYINKNFGGMLIIWDRLFGTYAEEVEPVKYGAYGLPSPKNPLVVVSQGWKVLYKEFTANFRECIPWLKKWSN